MAWFTQYQSRYSGASGTLRVALQYNAQALKLFKRREANAIIRGAFIAGGRLWVSLFMPKRFSRYADKLGYKSQFRWKLAKEAITGQPAIPFVGIGSHGGAARAQSWEPGHLRATALAGTRVSAVATANRQQIRISIPFGHPLERRAAGVFRSIPPWELDRIADEAVNVLRASIEAAGVIAPGRLSTRVSALSSHQVSRLQARRPSIGGGGRRGIAA